MNPPVEFGVVFSSEDGFARMPEPYPKGLAFLAVPGGAFDSAELRMKLHRIASGKVAIVPRELVAYEIAALLPEQNTALRIEFARFFLARCKRALELRCSEVGLLYDWERMFREPAYRDALVLLLRGSFGILDEYRLKLRLGVRLPGNADSYVRLLRDLLYPGISLSLECTPGAPDREALHRLRFYSDFFALHPEPETGSGWSADDIRTLVEAAGGLAARPRRIGIVTDDIQSAAALAAGYNRPAAAETAQIEGESSC